MLLASKFGIEMQIQARKLNYRKRFIVLEVG